MPKKNIPTYRLHKASGQAVVELDGKVFYLGKHKSKASRIKYDELIAEWLFIGTVFCRPIKGEIVVDPGVDYLGQFRLRPHL